MVLMEWEGSMLGGWVSTAKYLTTVLGVTRIAPVSRFNMKDSSKNMIDDFAALILVLL